MVLEMLVRCIHSKVLDREEIEAPGALIQAMKKFMQRGSLSKGGICWRKGEGVSVNPQLLGNQPFLPSNIEQQSIKHVIIMGTYYLNTFTRAGVASCWSGTTVSSRTSRTFSTSTMTARRPLRNCQI